MFGLNKTWKLVDEGEREVLKSLRALVLGRARAKGISVGIIRYEQKQKRRVA